MNALCCVLIFCVAFLSACESANVLGVFTSNSPSHLIIHMAYAKALAERGHNVTVVTTIPIRDKTHHCHHILTQPPEERLKKIAELKTSLVGSSATASSSWSLFKPLGILIPMQYEAFQDEKFQDLMHNSDNKFDLVILGYFFSDFMIGLGEHFNCPIVISWLSASNSLVNKYIGNPMELAYAPVFLPDGADPLKFTNRLKSFLALPPLLVMRFVFERQMKSYYNDLFPSPKYSPMSEASKRVSLVLCNSHFSEGSIRPNVPALIDVGGIQIKDKPDPLPQDLKTILDSSSEHGVVLFSFGLNVESGGFRPEVLQCIYEVLASLKQKVLWKFVGEDKPGDAPNIHYASWLPQDDVLAHPNLRLFITHAGKGSVTESQYHGVPMVAIPLFADQDGNAAKLSRAGFGLKLNFEDLNTKNLKIAVLEVLENPIYTENVKRFSNLYRDRPMTAKQTAVFWLEYVMRHKGAYHMQSPLIHLNSLQYLCLDVIAFLLLIAFISFKLISIPTRFVLRKIKKQKKA